MREQSFKNANNSRPNDIRGGETKVMKKLLSSLLVLALLLTMVVPAFAAEKVTDVNGKSYEDAVKQLVALGVVEGYTDGTFRGDNTITRAEFAKFVAYAAGFGDAASYFSTSSFKDVPADHWALGYIEAAASKGYVKGNLSGGFMPNDQVTVEQAVTVLLRVLGYNDEGLKGTWPGNYVLKASSLDFYANVDSKVGVATRGTVAQLLANGLNSEVVNYLKSDELFVGTGDTLMEKAFNNVVYTGVLQATANTRGAQSDASEDLAANEINIDGYTFELADGAGLVGLTSLDAAVGQQVNFIVANDKVAYVKAVNSKVVEGDVTYVAATETAPAKVSVAVNDTTTVVYDLSADAVALLNGVVANVNTFNAVEGTVYVNADGVATGVVGVEFAEEYVVVDTLYPATSYRDAKIVYTDGVNASVNVAKDAYIVKNGVVVSFADLKVNDVISIGVDGTSKATYIVAVSDKVEGKVSKVLVKDSVTTVTINGKNYVDSTSSVALNDEGTFLLNAEGKITKFIPVVEESTTVTGFLVGKYSETSLDADNKTVTKNYVTLNVAGVEQDVEVTTGFDSVTGDVLVTVTDGTATPTDLTGVTEITSVTNGFVTYDGVTSAISADTTVYVLTDDGLKIGVVSDINELTVLGLDNPIGGAEVNSVDFVTEAVTGTTFTKVTVVIIDKTTPVAP